MSGRLDQAMAATAEAEVAAVAADDGVLALRTAVRNYLVAKDQARVAGYMLMNGKGGNGAQWLNTEDVLANRERQLRGLVS